MAANPIAYGRAVQQEQAFISDWRRSFEAYRQEQRVAVPRPRNASSPAAAALRVPRKRTRTATPGPRRVREAKILRHCATADCGGRVRGRAELCTRCLRAKNGVIDDLKCARGCGNALGVKNRSGLCDVCLRHNQRVRKLGARPKCTHPGCEEILQRDNRTKLCGWHHPKFSRRVRYQGTSPKMAEASAE